MQDEEEPKAEDDHPPTSLPGMERPDPGPNIKETFEADLLTTQDLEMTKKEDEKEKEEQKQPVTSVVSKNEKQKRKRVRKTKKQSSQEVDEVQKPLSTKGNLNSFLTFK